MAASDSSILKVHRLVVGTSNTNSYVLVCSRTLESVIVDPGADADRILHLALPTRVKHIILTHGHADHTGALEEVQWKTGATVGVHPGDAERLPCSADFRLEDGTDLAFGQVGLRVLHLPGHTPGSVGFWGGGRLLSGDTVFPGGPGHTQGPEDFQQIVASIRDTVLSLPDTTKVLPGHGSPTTIGQVRQEYEAFTRRPGIGALFGDVLWLGQKDATPG